MGARVPPFPTVSCFRLRRRCLPHQTPCSCNIPRFKGRRGERFGKSRHGSKRKSNKTPPRDTARLRQCIDGSPNLVLAEVPLGSRSANCLSQPRPWATITEAMTRQNVIATARKRNTARSWAQHKTAALVPLAALHFSRMRPEARHTGEPPRLEKK